MKKTILNRIIACLLILTPLLFLGGCATPPPPGPEYVNFTVGVTGTGKTEADLESAYSLISNIKSPDNILIIYDASGSMRWPTAPGGEPRYKHAHKSLARYLEGVRASDNVGLIVYGSRYPSGVFGGKIQNAAVAKKSCTEDIVVTVPFGKFNKGSFRSELDRLSQSRSYRGDTPIGGAIVKATSIFKGIDVDRKHIILITDGAEECFNKGDRSNSVPGSASPEDAVQKAADEGITVSIVAYGVGRGKDGHVVANPEQALNSLRNLSTGVFVVANTGEELTKALMQVEVENFKFDLLDLNKKTVGKFSIGQTIQVDVSKYKDQARKSEAGPDKPPKMKFTITTAAEKGFQKDIGFPVNVKDVRVYLGLKSPGDMDPDILPPDMRWD
jgi:hypothetical protein